MDEEKYQRLVPADLQNSAERDLWNAVCYSMTGVSIFTSNAGKIEGVIERLRDETWRSQMRKEFVRSLLEVAVPDLEQITFNRTGAVAVEVHTLDTYAEPVDEFEANQDFDRMKAQTARRLAAALKESLSK